MMFRGTLLIFFLWVIIGAWEFEPPMSGVAGPGVYRIFYFHVPLAITTFAAYALGMYQAVRYLKSRRLDYDYKSAVAAKLGTLFCILATLTGSIFAKSTWGSFWNWDPRETSIAVLLLIYLAYFSLRSAVADPVRKANLSAVYSMLGFIAAIFTIFIWPRITPGLHPGSPGGGSTGAFIVMSTTTWFIFAPSVAAFLMLFTWLYKLSYRIDVLQRRFK